MPGFGHVASREELTTHNGRHGIMRSATAGVSLRSGAAEAWEESGNQRWFLPITAPALARAKTLRQLGDDIRRSPGDSESLRLLDLAATLLLNKFTQLHQARRGSGMLTPDNAVLIPIDQQPIGGDCSLLFLDHGFVFENSPFPPAWFSNPPEAGRALWEADIRDQQWREAANLTPAAEAADVRLLVRLFQGLLTGRWQRNLLTPAEVTALKTRSPKLWKILDRTLNAPNPSIQGLAEELSQFPLSSHFRAQPRPEVQPKKSWIPSAIAAVTIMASVVGGGWYFWQASKEVSTVGPDPGGGGSPGSGETETPTQPPPPSPPSVGNYAEAIAATTSGWTGDSPAEDSKKRNTQLSQILTQFQNEFSETHQKFQEKGTPDEWRANWKKLVTLTQQILDAQNVQTLPGLSLENQRDYQRCMRFIISLGGNVNVPESFQDSVARAKERTIGAEQLPATETP